MAGNAQHFRLILLMEPLERREWLGKDLADEPDRNSASYWDLKKRTAQKTTALTSYNERAAHEKFLFAARSSDDSAPKLKPAGLINRLLTPGRKYSLQSDDEKHHQVGLQVVVRQAPTRR